MGEIRVKLFFQYDISQKKKPSDHKRNLTPWHTVEFGFHQFTTEQRQMEKVVIRVLVAEDYG